MRGERRAWLPSVIQRAQALLAYCINGLDGQRGGARRAIRHKRSFCICLGLSALCTLFCVSMLIQVTTLPSTKDALQSFLSAHFGTNEWSNNEARRLFDAHYRQNKAFSVINNFDFWQPVSSSRHRFYVYSAYEDNYNRSNLNRDLVPVATDEDDPNRFVRVVAVTKLNTKEKVACCFEWSSNASLPTRIFREGWLRAIREHWNLKYSAFYVYCPLPRIVSNLLPHSKSSFSGVRLSILAFAETELNALMRHNAQLLHSMVPSNRLVIHTLGHTPPKSGQIAVCVKPLHYHYNQSIHLVEFIELNHLLGVEHFYFYNHTISAEVDHTLRHLVESAPSLVTVLPWLLPVKSQQEIRTEGIFASINDCLHRARTDQFKYAAFIDLDEFIIPQRHMNLPQMLATMQGVYKDQVGAYSFRNAFFYMQYADDPVDVVRDRQLKRIALQLLSLTKTSHKANLNKHKQRSKCIVAPEHTLELGNHFVWDMTSGRRTLNVNSKIAMLQHYRVCEFGGDECVHKSVPATNRRAHLWASKLISRVRQRLSSLCTNWHLRSESQMCELVADL